MLPEERQAAYRRFIREYETVRKAEGRGSDDAAYYCALPFADLSGQMPESWAVRAKSYFTLIEQVIAPLEASDSKLRIVDVGAGNCWLSYRLAERGHNLLAVDLLVNTYDGLGAHIHYPRQFIPVQAEFDRLPLASGQADVVIFNASFHYSTGFERTLREAQRVLSPDGRLVILDTPIYRDPTSGKQMVQEREAQFLQMYGFASNTLESENFLTFVRLRQLEKINSLRFEMHRPRYGLAWRLKPWIARLRGSREPAQFLVLSAQSVSDETVL
jgi:SAM-dependent methyltransferase